MRRRIVITGLGVVSPVGIGPEAYWQALASGVSGVAPITRFEVGDFPVKTAAEVRDFKPRDHIPERKAIKVMSRDLQLSVAAACMAVRNARIITEEKRVDPTRLGCSFGAGLINTDLDEFAHAVVPSVDDDGNCLLRKFGVEVMKNLFPLWLLKYLPNMPAAHISIFYDAQGPTNSITTGDTASTQAVGEACRVIERDAADVMICGGADAKINPLSMVRYHLSGDAATGDGEATKLSRPFAKDRCGFVVGEGGAAVILEEYEHARARGTQILAEVVGYGAGCDAWKVSDYHPDGRGSQTALRNALTDAGLKPSDVQLVFASANGSKRLDGAEGRALETVFGHDGMVTSTKSMQGHISVASGLLDTVAAVLALQHKLVPPTINCPEVDPECPINVVTGEARKAELTNVMVNSLGFGGQCAALVIRKLKA